MTRRRVALAASIIAVALTLAACGSDGGGQGGTAGKEKLSLVASFYPLQWMAQQVAGNRATVGSLTKPGAEPHDLELTPKDVATVSDADLVVYLKGFQPAVDDAVAQEASDHAFDASKSADLSLTFTPIEEGKKEGNEATVDPHFWLDPTRLAAVTTAFQERLTSLDPDGAATYRRNATHLVDELGQLDSDYRTGLASCANKDLVTSHNAFGYLSQRYGMRQVGITGLTPDQEPSPSDLAAVTDFVRANDVKTIYYETLVSPAIANTVARETGAATEVLDPIEGLTKQSQGNNYLQIMRSNLANIRKGQPCP